METELVNNLKNACDGFLKGIRSLELGESRITSAMEQLESKRASLQKEVSDLEIVKANLSSQIAFERKSQIEVLDKKSVELNEKDRELSEMVGRLKVKEVEYLEGKKEMEKAKKDYEEKFAVYSEKIEEINKKKEALAGILG